ncbi:alpha/beta fold hydrolase [Mucilaginibacter agri]|uniref:Alpha/beta fold hydrolase n=1 Tax=Mucilaginibacter agri TaxID=2695265 RepID=A0A965ZGW8_9SPHI|nr:alpha/beta hydrolase [Mucilaginibacter agri]NCD70848.1 alpha/beta fold hydrolase [Mucilaginibacter agri]
METANSTVSVAQGFDSTKVKYKTISIESQDIFYREAGSPDKPTLLLLHGFPTSSHMFRNLINALSGKYHLVAPDYPGFGNSSMPLVSEFEYTFDHLADIIDQFIKALGLTKYSLYTMDYGAPVGYRLAVRHPENVQALLIQNGNAYEDGLSPFWDKVKEFWANPDTAENIAFADTMVLPESTKWQYHTGVRDIAAIGPDAIALDQLGLDRPGNAAIQRALLYDYRTNPGEYPKWQAYFREYQPAALITWGKNDEIFPIEGAYAYQKDLKNTELHALNTGHFALEEDGDLIATLIDQFLAKNNIR